MRTRIIDIVGEVATRRPVLVLMASAVLAVAGAWLGLTRLQLDADTDHLIRPDRPFMVRYQRFMDEFGDLEHIYVVIDTRPDEAKAQAAASALDAKLRRIEGLRGVRSVVAVEEQLRIALRAASDGDLADLALAGEGVGALIEAARGAPDASIVPLAHFATERLRQSLRPTQGQGAASTQGQAGDPSDPGALRSGPAAQAAASAVLVLKAIAAGADPAQAGSLGALLPQERADIHLRADGGRYLLIQVLPVKNFESMAVIERPLAEIRQAIAEVAAEHPGVEIGLTGKPVLQADELATSNADMVRGAGIGLGLCALLLMVAMHGVLRPLMAVGAFLAAFGWTYGFATLAMGRLNLLSMVFMLVLVANGLDYGVHVIARYLEERTAAPTSSIQRAVQAAVRVSLRGNLTGALTSCAVFLTALATNFQGLRELGILASGGLLLCVVAMGTALPAMLVLIERRHRFTAPQLARGAGRAGVLGVPLRWPGATLAAGTALTLLLAAGLTRLTFEENLLELQNPALDSVRWERRLAAESAGNSWFGAVIVDSIDEVPAVIERARQQPAIGAVRSALDVVKLPSELRHRLERELRARAATGEAAMQAMAGAASTPVGLAAALEDALGSLRIVAASATMAGEGGPAAASELGALVGSIQRLAGRLRRAPAGDPSPARLLEQSASSAHEAGASLATMLAGAALPLRDSLPEAVRDASISPGGRFLVMLHPAENVWDAQHMRAFIEALRAVDPEATGVPFTHYESLVDMRRAFLIMAVLSVVLVALLVLADFRRPLDVLLALVPLGLSLAWTLSLMGFLGVPLNLANFFAVPILIGLGVDGAVHLLHRYHERGHDPLDPGSTRRAFILTNLTTTIGFAPLLFAEHRGMRSLGAVMVLGNTASLVAVLVVLPAMLALRERRRAARGDRSPA